MLKGTDTKPIVVDERDLVRAVIQCADCLSVLTAVEIAESGYRCPSCFAAVCVMCGCTAFRPCLRGCRWISPGIFSTHETDLRAAVEKVFGLTRGCA